MLHDEKSSSGLTGLIPCDPLGQRLTQIFSHAWHFIYRDVADECWQTETRYPLQPRNLWAMWQDAATLIGVRFGRSTSYALIDIDFESIYHPDNDPAALPRLRAALEAIGIYRTLLVRSSESGGLHLYICLGSDVPTYGLALALKHCLESADFALAPGALEIFPNVKSYSTSEPTNYHGHRLPLQAGSFLLDDDCEIITDRLPYFLKLWDAAAAGNDIDELSRAIAAAVAANKRISFRSKGRSVNQWRADDEHIISEGWTAPGQTNELVKVIARHAVVFKSLSGEALIEYVHRAALDAPGYEQHCNHHRDIRRRARDWSIAAEKHYRPYRSHPQGGNLWRASQPDQRLIRNTKTSENAIDRIRQASIELRDWGIDTVRGLAREIAAIARCSVATLYKHLSLWHPQHNGCNSQNEPVEPIPDVEIPIEEIHPKTLEPADRGLLHPNAPKKVVDQVTPKILSQKFKKQTFKLSPLPPGFDFRKQRHQKTPWKPLPGRVSRRFRLIYFSGLLNL